MEWIGVIQKNKLLAFFIVFGALIEPLQHLLSEESQGIIQLLGYFTISLFTILFFGGFVIGGVFYAFSTFVPNFNWLRKYEEKFFKVSLYVFSIISIISSLTGNSILQSIIGKN